MLVVFVWQMVGVWRSATNYQRIRLKSYWGGIAKFLVIIALLRTIVEFGQTGAPQIAEYYKIYAGDNEVGKYTFRVLGDGRNLNFLEVSLLALPSVSTIRRRYGKLKSGSSGFSRGPYLRGATHRERYKRSGPVNLRASPMYVRLYNNISQRTRALY